MKSKNNKQVKIEDLKVVGDNIFVKPLKEKEQLNGLVNPTQYEDKAYKGEVISVGDTVKSIKKGDVVFFNRYSTTSYEFNNEEYLSLCEEDVIAYI
jgi:chaperonin GroES